ncbi:hypothetical protein BSKO_03357 [Bryopsis sp. KO-2023]|nr:hypothetical protein BSKO_03357 [Bryopsis sp. KO-2023]
MPSALRIAELFESGAIGGVEVGRWAGDKALDNVDITSLVGLLEQMLQQGMITQGQYDARVKGGAGCGEVDATDNGQTDEPVRDKPRGINGSTWSFVAALLMAFAAVAGSRLVRRGG